MNDTALQSLGIKNPMLAFMDYLDFQTPAYDLAQLDADQLQRAWIAADRLKRHAALAMDSKDREVVQ